MSNCGVGGVLPGQGLLRAVQCTGQATCTHRGQPLHLGCALLWKGPPNMHSKRRQCVEWGTGHVSKGKTSEIDQLFDTKCCKIWTPKDGCCVAGNGGMAGVCGRPVHWTGPSEALGGHHTTPVGVGPVSCVCTVWTQKMQQLSTLCSEIVCAQGRRHRRAEGWEMLNNF